jgi:eukaryotic-like serine/threonine-protein kinase
VDYDRSRVIAAYRAALAIDPDNTPALNNLSIALQEAHQYAAAESLSLRATQVGRSPVLWENLLLTQVAQGKLEAARETVARHARLAPTSPYVAGQRARLALVEGDYATGTRLTRELRDQQRNSPLWQIRTGGALGRLARLQGKLRESERAQRELMAVAESAGQPDVALGAAAEIAMLDGELRARPDSGLATLSQALAHHPLVRMPALNRPYPVLVMAYARLGKTEQARRLLREYETDVPAGLRRGDPLGLLATGELAEAEGRFGEAVAAYRAAGSVWECAACSLLEEARAADRAGQADSALALYDRGFAVPSLDRYVSDAYALPAALKRAGELYEARGDRRNAADRYRRFVELWKDADPELQPGVREIRERLARLATESAS